MAGSWHRILGGRDCEAAWRPIKFKDSVPEKFICDYCGGLPYYMVTLNCGHRICGLCLEGFSVDIGGYCPMHVASVRARTLSWEKGLQNNLYEMKVYCWNRENGCTVECRVEDLHEHFVYECNYHVTSCPRCDATVLRRHLPAHCKAGCTGLDFLPASADEAGNSSRERVLASIQAGVSVLVEGMNELNLRTSNDRERTPSLEKGTRWLFRSVREFVGNSQDACTVATLAENSSSRMYGQKDGSCKVEDQIVLKLTFHPFDSEYPYDLWKDDLFTLRILGEITNLEIQILMSSIANSACLFAKVTGPGVWCMPEIEPLPFDYQSTSPYTAWIHRTLFKESERPTDSAIDASFSLRCMVRLPPPVPKKMFQLTYLKFLVKIRKCYTSNSIGRNVSHHRM